MATTQTITKMRRHTEKSSFIAKLKPPGETKEWSIRTVKREKNDGSSQAEPHGVHIRFFKRDGKSGIYECKISQATSKYLYQKLKEFDAALPKGDDEAHSFLKELLAIRPIKHISLKCTRSGFRASATAFVMPNKRYGINRSRYVWVGASGRSSFAREQGTFDGYRDSVLRLSRYSPQLTLAVLIALAAPLPSYVLQKRKTRLLSENGTWLFFGDSSTGKTNCLSTTLSVFGDPGKGLDFQITERGLVEAANTFNDLALPLDDTELLDASPKEMYSKISFLGHRLGSGKSKRKAEFADNEYPEVEFSVQGVITSPMSAMRLANQLNRPTYGVRARVINISAGHPQTGGIFDKQHFDDRLPEKNSAELIKMLRVRSCEQLWSAISQVDFPVDK